MRPSPLFRCAARRWHRPHLWVLAWGAYVSAALVLATCLQPPLTAQVCAAVGA